MHKGVEVETKTHPNELSEVQKHVLYEVHIGCERAIKTKNKVLNSVRSAVTRALLDGDDATAGLVKEATGVASSVISKVLAGKDLPASKKFDVEKAARATMDDIERGGLSVDPWLRHIKASEKAMIDIVKDLPIMDEFVRPLKGFGELSFARILAEAGGDLWTYPNPAKLWRRFGLAVINGEAQGHPNGYGYKKGVSVPAGAWDEHHISKRRRAISYVAFSCVIRSKTEPYYSYFIEKKNERQEKMKAAGAANWKVVGMKHGHRLMEKRILKELLIAYNKGNPNFSAAHNLDTSGVVTSESVTKLYHAAN